MRIRQYIWLAVLVLSLGSVASASPILDSWGFEVDGIFTYGSWGNITTDAGGNIISVSGTAADMGNQINGLNASLPPGVAVTAQLLLDDFGLGYMSVDLTTNSAGDHTVAMWLHYFFWDEGTGQSYGNGFYASVGTPIPGVDYTVQSFDTWNPDVSSVPMDNTNHVPAANLDPQSYCCNPVLAKSVTLHLLTGGTTTVSLFTPYWAPDPTNAWDATHYLNDPFVLRNTLTADQYYLSQQSGDSSLKLGTLYGDYVPEPPVSLLVSTGLLLLGKINAKRLKRSR